MKYVQTKNPATFKTLSIAIFIIKHVACDLSACAGGGVECGGRRGDAGQAGGAVPATGRQGRGDQPALAARRET